MAFGTGDRRKADVAEGVAVAVGHAATRRGNRLGVVTFGERVDPSSRRDRVAARCCKTLRTLREVPPGGSGSSARRARPDRSRRDASGRSSSSSPTSAARSTGARRCCGSPAGTPCWRSRCATRASRSSPTSASCGSSIRRPAGSCASTPATGACASGSPSAASEERRALAASLASAGVGHVALSTEGDWLRPLAAFLRRRQAHQVSFAAPILLALPARRPGCGRAVYVWLDGPPRRTRRRVGAGGAARRTWSSGRRAGAGTLPMILLLLGADAAPRRLRAPERDDHRQEAGRDRRARARRLGLDGGKRLAADAARSRAGRRAAVRRRAAEGLPHVA